MKDIKQVLTESMDNAYMIRNDGTAFRMGQHVYGSYEEIEETLYAAEWLYKHTNHKTTKQTIINFIASWGAQQYPEMSVVDSILNVIETRPYKFLNAEFIEEIRDELDNSVLYKDIDSLNIIVADELNQEFLRARYGGMYNTTAGSREMVFRVSSVGYDWYNIIFTFVYDRKSRIDFVTIVKDEESTGFNDAYYHRGEPIFRMPIDDFILMRGTPVIEACSINTEFENRLKSGMNIVDAIDSRMNFGRLADKWSRMKYEFFTGDKEL